MLYIIKARLLAADGAGRPVRFARRLASWRLYTYIYIYIYV